jgi:hypothetical protein
MVVVLLIQGHLHSILTAECFDVIHMFLIVVVYWSHTLVSTALRIAVATIPYLQYIQDVRFLHGQITCCSFTSAARRAREVLEVLNSAHFTRVYMVHSTSPLCKRTTSLSFQTIFFNTSNTSLEILRGWRMALVVAWRLVRVWKNRAKTVQTRRYWRY